MCVCVFCEFLEIPASEPNYQSFVFSPLLQTFRPCLFFSYFILIEYIMIVTRPVFNWFLLQFAVLCLMVLAYSWSYTCCDWIDWSAVRTFIVFFMFPRGQATDKLSTTISSEEDILLQQHKQ